VRRRKKQKEEVEEVLIAGYAEKIRAIRNQLGLKQEDFAKKLQIKESILHKLEGGSFRPSLPLAKKIGRILAIRLVERREPFAEQESSSTQKQSGEPTVGDIVKIKKRGR
jgi:uncharacterized protein (TIGR00270 family)